jgi:photosystem II stability/assembly factor-like uncharacterized protein
VKRIRFAVHALFATSLLLLLPVFKGLAQEDTYREDFEDGQAQGWELGPGWDIALDGSNHVLSGEGHVWARSGQSSEGDHRVSFRLKLLAGRIHLVVRLTDASRYFLGFTAEGSDLSKQYFPDEFHENLARGGVAHALNRWVEVQIVTRGSTIEMWVDGKREWSYTDPQPLTEGSFALETQEGARAYVDDVVIERGSAPSSAPATSRPRATSVPSSSPGALTWVRTGGPLGGLGYDIRMRPDNPDIMFVTDAKSGVFKSTDGGQTWEPKNNGITARSGSASDEIPVFCLTIDPNDYETIWVGTQNQRGFFKSTDNGESWRKMDSGVVERGLTTRGFAVDPYNSDVVYAAGEISSWEWAGRSINGREFDLVKGVVYKTTNGGQSWKKVWQGDNLARYVWIDPRDTDVLYVSTGIFDREAANSDLAHGQNGGVGVLKSTDGGQTWRQINRGLGNLYVGSLFMHPENPDILLAGTGAAWESPGSGVYLTTDGGESWHQTLSASPMIESVEFATADPQIAYAGGFGGVYRSEDGGHTWRKLPGEPTGWGAPGIMAGHPFDFQVDPRDPDRIFSNQYSGGNFLSLDGGQTWEPASKGYTGSSVRDIVVDPTQPGRVIVAARSGIFASYNGGEDWVGLSFPPFYFPDWHALDIDPSNPQHLLSELTCWRNLVSSNNGGRTWRQVYQFPDGSNKAFADIAFAPSDPKVVYAASAGFISCGHITSDVPSSGFNATLRKPGAGVFISQDGGGSWRQSPDSQMQELTVGRLAVDPENPSLVYAATFYTGLYRSTDAGRSWTKVGGGLPGHSSITTVGINPHDRRVIYAGVNQRGLFRSEDEGASWRQVAAGLPAEGVITDVEFDLHDPQVMYASEVFSGVYRSRDGGKTWQAINGGLDVRSINALALSSDGQHLYAASEGSGVYRLDLNGQPPPAAPIPSVLSGTPSPALSPTRPSSTPGPSPTRSAPTAIPRRTTSPTAPAEGPAAPTSAQSGRPGFCGGAAVVPLTMVGWAWWRASRKGQAR